MTRPPGTSGQAERALGPLGSLGPWALGPFARSVGPHKQAPAGGSADPLFSGGGRRQDGGRRHSQRISSTPRRPSQRRHSATPTPATPTRPPHLRRKARAGADTRRPFRPVGAMVGGTNGAPLERRHWRTVAGRSGQRLRPARNAATLFLSLRPRAHPHVPRANDPDAASRASTAPGD